MLETEVGLFAAAVAVEESPVITHLARGTPRVPVAAGGGGGAEVGRRCSNLGWSGGGGLAAGGGEGGACVGAATPGKHSTLSLGTK